MMQIFYTAVFLILLGLLAWNTYIFVGMLLGIAGGVGTAIAGVNGDRPKPIYWIGVLIAAIPQSYLYLAFVAFVTALTTNANRNGPIALLLWPLAFFVVAAPISRMIWFVEKDYHEYRGTHPQVRSFQITRFVAVISLFVFAFAPRVAQIGWRWVPYVQKTNKAGTPSPIYILNPTGKIDPKVQAVYEQGVRDGKMQSDPEFARFMKECMKQGVIREVAEPK